MTEKLIRDRIPHIAEIPSERLRRASDEEEFLRFLELKLSEEVAEFLDSKSTEELADILEVIASIADVICGGSQEVSRLREAKKALYGAFHDRLILLDSL